MQFKSTISLFSLLGPAAALSLRQAADAVAPRQAADNSTIQFYVVQENDTMPEIAAYYNRGICDIARQNKLADALQIFVNQNLTIPAAVPDPDNTTCYLTNNTAATATCVYGGPHVYFSLEGDTVQRIANVLFNMSVEPILTYAAGTVSGVDQYAVLPAGTEVKIPVCANTSCTIAPFSFDFYGVLKDISEEFNVSVGQIMGFNPGYHESAYGAVAPSLELVTNCVAN